MHEELQTAVTSGKIEPKAAEILENLQPGHFGIHKDWGFGEVVEWNLLAGQIRIDFQSKKGHLMEIQYAADTMLPLSKDHVVTQIAMDPEAIRNEAKEDALGLVRRILGYHQGKATAEQIHDLLVPHVFKADAYKKWWESTKKKLRVDGLFSVPTKKSDPIVLREEAIDRASELLIAFQVARQLKQRIVAAEQIAKALEDFSEGEKSKNDLQDIVFKLGDVARKNLRLNPAQALELLFVREDIIDQIEAISRRQDALMPSEILQAASASLDELFLELPASKQKRALALLPEAFGDEWGEAATRLMQRARSRLVGEIVHLFEQANREEELNELLRRSIADRSLTVEVLHWLAGERKKKPNFATPDLFNAILHALEQNQLDSDRHSSRLHDLVRQDKDLIHDLLGSASAESVRDIVRKLIQSSAFEKMDKGSLLGRIVKIHPEVENFIGGEDSQQQEALTVSWASLERRKKEYDDLVHKQIPQNTRDIRIARSYGDLRENFEFKSAKEMQSVLLRRKAEIEQQLGLARGTNFEDPDTSVISIGTTAILEDVKTGATERYHILGAWDGAPEHHIVSYQAGIGKVLIGRKVGDEVDLPTETDVKKIRVKEIAPFTELALLD